MTAHRVKPTITAERIAWFADYFAHYGAWGVFHVWLDDGNYGISGYPGWTDGEPDDVREAAAWFLTLTPSQQKRLGQKAEMRGHGEPKCPRC